MQPGHRADRQGVGKTLQRLKVNVCTANGKLIRSHRTTAPCYTRARDRPHQTVGW